MAHDGKQPLSKENALICRELVSNVSEQRHCLNSAVRISKLKKLRNGKELIEKTNRAMAVMADKSGSVCKSGCAVCSCCSQLFKVTAVELEVISFHLMNNPAALEAFLNNYLGRLEATEQELLQQMYEVYTNGTDQEQRDVSVRYFELNIPCAFLNQHAACMIYDLRPLVCAGFISYNIGECVKSPSGSITVEMRQLLASSLNKLKLGSKRLALESDLSTMVFWHIEDLAERGGQAVML